MRDNEFYIAVMEGRMPIRIGLGQEGDQWVATHDQFGIDITVKDDSMRMAEQEVKNQVMDRIRKGEFSIKYA
jgi:hypothetical protein